MMFIAHLHELRRLQLTDALSSVQSKYSIFEFGETVLSNNFDILEVKAPFLRLIRKS